MVKDLTSSTSRDYPNVGQVSLSISFAHFDFDLPLVEKTNS